MGQGINPYTGSDIKIRAIIALDDMLRNILAQLLRNGHGTIMLGIG